jgi:chloramphenicol 3-O phosphotransferase
MPLVIVLSGPSSSGKTTLGHALQERLAEPCVLVEADRTFPAVPAGLPGAEVVLAFHRSVAVWAECGFHVIVDGSLPYENLELLDRCLRVFEPFDLRLVGVRCSDAELAARETSRPEDRPRGWAVRQAKDIHDGMRYAAEVDTTAKSPEECADEVAMRLGLSIGRPA